MWVKYLIRLPIELYNWLVDYSDDLGETIATVIRRAIREFKEKHDK